MTCLEGMSSGVLSKNVPFLDGTGASATVEANTPAILSHDNHVTSNMQSLAIFLTVCEDFAVHWRAFSSP